MPKKFPFKHGRPKPVRIKDVERKKAVLGITSKESRERMDAQFYFDSFQYPGLLPEKKIIASRLRNALNHADVSARIGAIKGLTALGDKQDFARIVKRLKKEGNIVTREAIAGELWRFKSKTATSTLLDLAINPKENYGVRKAAMDSIIQLKDKRAVPTLLWLARDGQNPSVQIDAMLTVYHLEDSNGINQIKKMLQNNELVATLKKSTHFGWLKRKVID